MVVALKRQMRTAAFCTIAALCDVCALMPSIQAIAADSSVPCAVFNNFRGYVRPGFACANPFVQGIVDGQWVGVIMEFGGGNGGATSAQLFTSGVGGNGSLTINLGKIRALSAEFAESSPDSPDGLVIFFGHGKMWAVNKVAHNLWNIFVVRRFGFHSARLVVENQRILEGSSRWSQAQFQSAVMSP